jgi:hypothetical protein
MTTQEILAETLKKSRATARTAYRKAMSEAKPPETIVRLALAAGVTDAEIAEDGRIVDRAAALAEAADGHAELAKKLVDANQRHADTSAEYQTAVNAFLERLTAISEEISVAQDAAAPAQKALNELCELYRAHADILPPPPAPVRTLLEAQTREEEIAASREGVRRSRSAAGAIERELLAARNGVRAGATTVSRFNQKTMTQQSTTLSPPMLADDLADVHATQDAIGQLEAELGRAQENAKQVADRHAARFDEQVL